MAAFCDLIWDALHTTGISWVGFYVHESGDQLILACCRNKPACSPIGLHGACGQVFIRGTPLVVRDVKELGDNYIACDPRDRSEVVIPLQDDDGLCWGVLDLDSYEVGAFSDADVQGLTMLLQRAGLITTP